MMTDPKPGAEPTVQCPATHHDELNHLDDITVCICKEIRAAVQARKEKDAKIAEVHIHGSTPEKEEDRDDLDNIAAYSNTTCKIIAAEIRAQK
jgi:hypothetical protein